MKRFYTIKGGVACKETKNVYPQILRPVALKGSDLYYKVTGLKNRPNLPLATVTIELELDPKTNLTDFISQSWIDAVGLLVSNRAYQFLSAYNLQPEIEVYNALVHHKGEKHEYVWLNPIHDYDADIDFEKTSFFLWDILEKTKTPVKVADARDLNRQNMNNNPLGFVTTDHLVLKNKKALNYDMLFISIGSTNFRVSEYLKNKLEETNLTAFAFSTAIPFS